MLENPKLKTWVMADPLPVFDFPYHTFMVEYQEFNTTGATGRGYEYAGQGSPGAGAQPGQALAPPLRLFSINFSGLKYYLDDAGEVDLFASPQLNLARLDRFYQTHSLADQFIYPHPFYGNTLVRFSEPVEIPFGVLGGLGFSEALTVKLVEVPTSLLVKKNFFATAVPAPLKIGSLWVFDFPFHRVSTRYQPESSSYLFGGNYTFRTGRSKPEQRTFKLQFESLRRVLDASGKVNLTETPQTNLGWLEYFYLQHRNTESFYYPHPVYGNIKVRFKSPPTFPEALVRGLGWTQMVELELIEVM